MKELIPGLQELPLVFLDQMKDLGDLLPAEAVAAVEFDRVEPELRLAVVPLNVNVGRLTAIARVEEESERSTTEYRGHALNATVDAQHGQRGVSRSHRGARGSVGPVKSFHHLVKRPRLGGGISLQIQDLRREAWVCGIGETTHLVRKHPSPTGTHRHQVPHVALAKEANELQDSKDYDDRPQDE
jgi:hypothetical protein